MRDSLAVLTELGLTEYECKVAIMLLKSGPSIVQSIASISGVPRNKVYGCLDTLMQRGLVQSLVKYPKEYYIRDVSVFATLIEEKKQKLNSLSKDVGALKNIVPIAASRKDIVWSVQGHHAFVSSIKSALQSVSKENLILAVKLREDPVVLRLTRDAIKRGAVVKLLLNSRVDSAAWRKIGAQVRYTSEKVTMAYSLFDDSICRLSPDVVSADDTTLWIESKQLVSILRKNFEELWENAKKLK